MPVSWFVAVCVKPSLPATYPSQPVARIAVAPIARRTLRSLYLILTLDNPSQLALTMRLTGNNALNRDIGKFRNDLLAKPWRDMYRDHRFHRWRLWIP